ncbi:hypothetical protein U0070_023059 [Myodes glareolus]|uniref:Uncharacterized protein n=1 Tax=Myodes glareolus TaxID=447135 RepID=A0AAW0HRW0_MYOGA
MTSHTQMMPWLHMGGIQGGNGPLRPEVNHGEPVLQWDLDVHIRNHVDTSLAPVSWNVMSTQERKEECQRITEPRGEGDQKLRWMELFQTPAPFLLTTCLAGEAPPPPRPTAPGPGRVAL